ncbi:type VI secretion protein [Streptomyces sp. BPTC-684]|uniref:type VI secretion protein n=1 Tax=Streptomyces sp. BPTC-684 TaxID=3043734 RepID=UPI0024B25DC7|nr:type VI secretion protein [Streptomyces sp. BPTC-684]WHM37521.1 type VI secretion protein [Streptomyces sp. BPTC-684]
MPESRSRGEERGIPDSLLIGLLAFLLGLTVLVWTATGLAGLFSHGAWPDAVTFTRTPLAMRQLIQAPHDLPAAWPDTPAAQLSGYGLFWGLLIGQLLVLLVLFIFALGTWSRWRAVRARAKAAAAMPGNPVLGLKGGGGGEPGGYGTPTHQPQAPTPTQAGPPPVADAGPGAATAGGPPAGADWGADPSATRAWGPAAGTGAARTVRTDGSAGAEGGTALTPAPGTASWQPDGPAVGRLPSPRAARPPRLVYGGPDARRPTAVQAIQDAEGAALVITSDPTLWAETKDARAKLGPVHVYDPGHLCDTPARLHWSPTSGCEDADVAATRATALLAPVRPQARIDAAMADTAETLLRCWLHAAALDSRDGKAVKQMHRWAQGTGAHEAVRILRTHPKAMSGSAGLLESALTAHPERREIAQELTARALDALSSIHIREACTPNRADSLALESFAAEGGTLYVVGEAIEDPRSRPAAMPLLTALASDVVERGRRMAERSPDGRLDPPMTLVLDDVAAVAPLPRLPELLSTGQDLGLPTLVLLRSAEQARARWTETLAP